VGVDEHRPQVGEILNEASLRRAHNVADGRRVLEAGDADHDVGSAEARDLVADGRRECGHWHRCHRTTGRPPVPFVPIVIDAATKASGVLGTNGTTALSDARRRRWPINSWVAISPDEGASSPNEMLLASCVACDVR